MAFIRSTATKFRLRGVGQLALASGVGPGTATGTAATSITLTDVVDQRVYQRIGTSRVVPVAGTYGGPASTIQARVIDASSSAEVVAWTTVATNPTGGSFSGQITVPQGGWYKIQVRDGVNTAITAAGVNKFGVGMVVAKIGQSNMADELTEYYRAPLGDPRAVEWNGSAFIRVGNVNDAYAPNTLSTTYSSFTSVGNRGDGHVYFANLLSQNLNIPVCIVNKAVIGSAVADWQSGQKNWNDFVTAINAVGGDFELCIWYQGETDAQSFVPATYKSQVANIQANCKALATRTDSNFKFGVVSLGPGHYLSSVEGDFGKMRVTQIAYATQTAGAFLAGCNYDTGTPSDGVHISGEGYGRAGRRYAKNTLYQYGIGASGAGPKVASATRSGTTVTVNITHSGGTALTDGNGGTGTALTGFRVFDGATQMTISSTAISGNTIVLTLASTPTGTVTLDHAIMNVPSGSGTGPITFNPAGCVYDNATYYNSTIGCPLQPCAAITVA